MSRTPAWRRYLRLWGPDVEADVRDELEFHIDMRTDELVEQGWTREEARQEALRLFGNEHHVRQECAGIGMRKQHTKRRLAALAEFWMDVRFGARVAIGRPVLSIVVVLSLALGIGANTAIFTVTSRVVLDQLPVEMADELILLNWAADERKGFGVNGRIRETDDGKITSTSFSYSAFRNFAEERGALAGLFAFTELRRLNLNLGGEAVLERGQLVSGSFFSVLGLQPHLGRMLDPTDDRRDAPPAAVLAHSFWQSRCGADPAVLGEAININGVPFTVVGIAQPGFSGTLQVGRSPAVFIPLAQHGPVMQGGDRSEWVNLWWIQIMGRLAPGFERQQAQAMLDPVLVATVAKDLGHSLDAGEEVARIVPRLRLSSGARGLQEARNDMIDPLLVAFGIAVLILIIACANAATLLLAGAESRSAEMAVRVAIGAGRFRIVRQLLTESLMLAFIGGILGLALSLWLSRILAALMASTTWTKLAIDLTPDPAVLAFSAGMSLLSGFVFGIIPALKILKVEIPQVLREGGRGRLGATRSQHRLGTMLVIAQVAVSLVLLVLAGLFFRTLSQLRSVDMGFESEGVLTFRISANLNGYHDEELLRFCEQIRDGLAALPEVSSATMAGFSPVTGSGRWDRVDVPDGKLIDTYIGLVDPHYFETMPAPLLYGRPFTSHDGPNSPLVAVVNESFVRDVFGDSDPIGAEFSIGSGQRRATYRVLGVLPDARTVSLQHEPGPMMLLPLRQDAAQFGTLTYFLRTPGRPEMLAARVREVVRGVDPNVPVFAMRTLSEHVDQAMHQEREFTRLSLVAAALALVLACIGIYATVSFAVSRRTQEIGIRISLGASRSSIVLSAMRQMRAVALGAAIGLLGAWALARALKNMVFGIASIEPLSALAATALLLGVAALAVFAPARRASCVDPMKVLRLE